MRIKAIKYNDNSVGRTLGWLNILLLSMGVMFSQNSLAIPISSTGGSQNFTVNFGGNVGGTDLSGLNGKADFSLAGIDTTGKVWTFDVGLANTTNNTLFGGARISLLGFAVDPNARVASSTGLFTHAVLNKNINANGGIATNVCVNGANGNNCNGGGGGGVSIGETGIFSIALKFDSKLDKIDFSNFGIRWQSLNSSQYTLASTSGTGTGVVGVPSPAPLALMGLGLIGLVAVRRKTKI